MKKFLRKVLNGFALTLIAIAFVAIVLVLAALCIAYAPIYIAAYIVHKIARLVLAICYFLTFRWKMGVGVIKHLFKYYGRN